jgi:hypothetical protein
MLHKVSGLFFLSGARTKNDATASMDEALRLSFRGLSHKTLGEIAAYDIMAFVHKRYDCIHISLSL